MKSTLFFLVLACAFGVVSKEPLPIPRSNTVLSLMIGSGNLVKNHLAKNKRRVYFWVLSYFPWIQRSTLMLVPQCFDQCCFLVSFETPVLFFFLKIVLAIPGPLHFHVNFRISLSISTKKAVGIMKGTALTLWVALGSIITLSNAKSSNPCVWMIFPLLRLSFNWVSQFFSILILYFG